MESMRKKSTESYLSDVLLTQSKSQNFYSHSAHSNNTVAIQTLDTYLFRNSNATVYTIAIDTLDMRLFQYTTELTDKCTIAIHALG